MKYERGHVPITEYYWKTCTRCPLHKTRAQIVLGHGNLRAQAVFVGEGPGPTENGSGFPLQGDSGDKFNEALRHLKWDRDSIFIDNAVACWPVDVSAGTVEMRTPNQIELAACKIRLFEDIYRVDPIIIVALGKTAFSVLTGSTEAISTARGEIYTTRIPGYYKMISYPVFPTFHPAHLLRQPSRVNDRLFLRDLAYAKATLESLNSKYKSAEGL